MLLLNLGGPDTLDDVEEFLYNLFADPEIITLPSFLQWLNGPLAFVIARGRAPQSRGQRVSACTRADGCARRGGGAA